MRAFAITHLATVAIISILGWFVMNRKECQSIANGLLTKGLRTAIVAVTLATNDIISTYNKQVSDPTFIFDAYHKEVV